VPSSPVEEADATKYQRMGHFSDPPGGSVPRHGSILTTMHGATIGPPGGSEKMPQSVVNVAACDPRGREFVAPLCSSYSVRRDGLNS